jgi:hypothetical protein
LIYILYDEWRLVYFLTVTATVYLLTYPISSELPAAAEFSSGEHPIADLIRRLENLPVR